VEKERREREERGERESVCVVYQLSIKGS